MKTIVRKPCRAAWRMMQPIATLRRSRLAVRLAAAAIITAAPAMPAQAFGLRTHLWMGQQLVDELNRGDCGVLLRDRRLPEPPPYRAVVPKTVCDAIRHKPAAFLAGTLGPDAFPDILFGQMVIHPGVKNHPFSSWLRLLLEKAVTEEEIAFAYGVAVHASGDIFAHTYVNNYAGDIFSLSRGMSSDVEHRHLLIEKYIDRHMPAPSTVIAPAVPVDFVRRTLIFDEAAAVNVSGAIPAIAFRKLRTYARDRHIDAVELVAVAANKKHARLATARATWVGVGYRAEPTAGFDREDPTLRALPQKSQVQIAGAFELYRLAVEASHEAEATALFAEQWDNDIESAADAYITASLLTAQRIVAAGDTGQTVETMKSAMLPVQRWFTCYSRVLSGYPIDAIKPICEKLDTFPTDVDLSGAQRRVALPGPARKPYLLWLAADRRLAAIKRRLYLAIADQFDPTRITAIIRELADPAGVYPDTLNAAFKKGRSGQIALTCVSALIDADLGLRPPMPKGCATDDSPARIDPESFVALRHAMTLARLAILDQTAVRSVAAKMAPNEPLQLGADTRYSLIAATAISIDGNQQWSGLSMPYPKRRGYKPVEIITEAYGHGPASPPGFPFYQTEGLRRTVMTALFGAPFEGAILDQPEMRVPLYPFKPCAGDPFRPNAAVAPIEICAKPVAASATEN